MRLWNAAAGPNTKDEALARQSARSTSQYYQPSQQAPTPLSYDYARLQPQQQQRPFAQYQQTQDPTQRPLYDNGSASSAPRRPYGGTFNQPQQHHPSQPRKFYHYPGV
ncbi:unnamed protein product [Peronospora farinosa]|uniref:Uncharacterized protein n=1 Tax=Peronospora farinosa TaxID=134698 RepID=A0AAV0T4F8_9STRA|nr:unnamed protein product [Peronospora farinosa]